MIPASGGGGAKAKATPTSKAKPPAKAKATPTSKAKPPAKVAAEPEVEETDYSKAKRALTSTETEKKKKKIRQAKVDSHVPGSSLYEVEGDWDCMLNQTNIGFNNNKYYVIQLLKRRIFINW